MQSEVEVAVPAQADTVSAFLLTGKLRCLGTLSGTDMKFGIRPLPFLSLCKNTELGEGHRHLPDSNSSVPSTRLGRTGLRRILQRRAPLRGDGSMTFRGTGTAKQPEQQVQEDRCLN